jgi:hypothetical protein
MERSNFLTLGVDCCNMRRVVREWFVDDDLEVGSCHVFEVTLVTFARKFWERLPHR